MAEAVYVPEDSQLFRSPLRRLLHLDTSSGSTPHHSAGCALTQSKATWHRGNLIGAQVIPGGVGEYLRRATLLKYFRHLGGRCADNTIRRQFRAPIRRFFSLNDIPWPLKPSDLPPVSPEDISAPLLPGDYIRRMISAAKAPSTPPAYAAALGLATVYGFRLSEMRQVSADGADCDRRELSVRSAYSGGFRRYTIPDEILPVLQAGLPMYISAKIASGVFHHLLRLSGLGHIRRSGFQSVRRSLLRHLMEVDLPEQIVRDFMRARRQKSDQLEAQWLSALHSSQEVAVEEWRKSDSLVFRVHPYLPYWRETIKRR